MNTWNLAPAVNFKLMFSAVIFAILAPTHFLWRSGKTNYSKGAERRLVEIKKAIENTVFRVLRSNSDPHHHYNLSGVLDQEEADIFTNFAHFWD